MSFALTLGMLTHRALAHRALHEACQDCEMTVCPRCGNLGALGEDHPCPPDKEVSDVSPT